MNFLESLLKRLETPNPELERDMETIEQAFQFIESYDGTYEVHPGFIKRMNRLNEKYNLHEWAKIRYANF